MRILTDKQEAFAVAVAAGQGLTEAYTAAGYTWNGAPKNLSRQAQKMSDKPLVAARIAELRDQYAQRVVEASRGKPEPTKARAYSVADAMAELDETMAVAKENGNPGAMAKVVEVRMKLYGLGIAAQKNPNDEQPMSYEEAVKLLEEVKEARKGMH